MPDQDHWRLAIRSSAANQRVEVQDVIVPPTREPVMVCQRRSGCDYAHARVPGIIRRRTRGAWRRLTWNSLGQGADGWTRAAS